MINAIALWMLLSSMGAAVVMFQEPLLVHESGPLASAKQAGRESYQMVNEGTHLTEEGIKRAATSAYEAVKGSIAATAHATSDAAHTVQRKAGEAVDAVKDTSHHAAEKIGLISREPSNSYQTWQTQMQAVKDKATAAHDAAGDTLHTVNNGAQATLSNYGIYGEVPNKPSTMQHLKEKVGNVYDASGKAVHAVQDKASQAAEAVKNSAVQAAETVQDSATKTGEWTHDGVESSYHSAQDAASSLKKGAQETFSLGADQTKSDAQSIADMVNNMAQSVQDAVLSAGQALSGTTKDTDENATSTLNEAYKNAADALKSAGLKAAESIPPVDKSKLSYQEKIKQVTGGAADVLKQKAQEAAYVMPNVGQGLSMGDYSTGSERQVGEFHQNEKYRTSYHENTQDTLPPESLSWRERFLNKVGIEMEEDLNKYDVMVGSIKHVWTADSSYFHKAGDGLDSGIGCTRGALSSVENKASGTLGGMGETIISQKDAAYENLRRTRGKIDEASHQTTEGVKDALQNASDTDPDAKAQAEIKDIFLGNGTGNEQRKLKTKSNFWRYVGFVTTSVLLSLFRVLHLFSFSAAYGSSLWVTFISGYLLSRTIPRQQFGLVQSRMFPTYLKTIATGQTLCVILYMVLHPWSTSSTSEHLQYSCLWVTLLSTLANIFFLEPRGTKVMFEKLKFEKEEGRGTDSVVGSPTTTLDDGGKARLAEINKRFNVLHGYTSLLNLVGLVGLSWHLWYLSRRLVI